MIFGRSRKRLRKPQTGVAEWTLARINREPADGEYVSADPAADMALWKAAFDIAVARRLREPLDWDVLRTVVADADRILDRNARPIDIEAMIRISVGESLEPLDADYQAEGLIYLGVLTAIVRQLGLSADDTAVLMVKAEGLARERGIDPKWGRG